MLSALLSLLSRRLDIPPPALLALLYAALVATGTLVFKLPGSVNAPISWSDAIFTAASAVTVTGLAVVDTGHHFTLLGQAAIMALIQLGGLGLMTFAVLILSALGLPIGLPHKILLREDLNQTSVADVMQLVGIILRVVLVCELIGAILLAAVFVPRLGWQLGLWHALFHSVSAFNNAGFALFADSLSRCATDLMMNITVPALFIIGGIGFSVLSDVYRTRCWRTLSLHSKLMLSGTGVLIVWSVAAFAVLEWTNPLTLGQFSSTSDKLIVSWFQAVTARTAGFSTVEIGAIHDSTALMFISLMLIGGGSTSTAGGVKVTTFIVLLLATVAFFKRRSSLHVFGRSLGHEEVMKVLAVTTLSLLTVMIGTFVITLSQDANFLNLAFEVASGFGTVGLSRGTTRELDSLGRAVIIVIMFIGRIGPLTLGFFLATRVPPRISYPSSKIFLG
jgi:trk system potassium uptake protein TrkH